ncbi:HEPN domain-containing protein [Pantoea agglomerans]|uniref:HEPN domain-containing protein n=1 Tax=Enterobacter agglomerans TaxID=549 RepID=UPI0007E532A5|nr:HEPN domain-containing protein [Pantoea agglomerans]WHU87801.1 HEPN domain-containing protein [Pantoea agglomerans pv. gypsophilae]
MDIIITEFESRCNDIQELYNHIIKVSNEKGTVKISSILKASLYIAIYNNIEATFYSIFERVHLVVSEHEYTSLNDSLKRKISDFFSDSGDPSSINFEKMHLPLLKDYLKKKKIFSGNLDTRKGTAIFRTYGINYTSNLDMNCRQSLLICKNKRNKIAHGELSLPDAGKNSGGENLQKTVDNSKIVIRSFIESALKYLDDRSFI